MGSFWDDWTPDDWTTVTKGIGNAVAGVAKAADYIVPDDRKTKVAGGYSGIPATTTYDGANPLGVAFGAYMNVATAPVKTATKALDAGYQYGINRPLSTLIQAVGANNPLYADGFTFDDYVRMWNASEYINIGNAAGMTIAGTGIGADWAPDWAKPAYGSSREMQRSPFNFYIPENLGFENGPDGRVPVKSEIGDNTLYNISSGMIDQGIATVATAGVDKLAKVAKVGLGLNTVIDNTRDLAKVREEIAQGVLHAATGGTEGKWTVYGQHIEDIAKATTPAEIIKNPLISNSPNSNKLASMLSTISERETVARLVMADKGDRYAIASLAKEDPHLTWALSNMTERLQAQIANTGVVPLLDKNAAAAIEHTFNSQINRQPSTFYKNMYDMFLAPEADASGNAVSGLRDAIRVSDSSKPVSGIAGRVGYMAKNAPGRLAEGDGWVAHTFSSVSNSVPVTVGMEWLGGRMPKGSIQLSEATPSEVIDELMSQVGRLPFTRGTREWTFRRNGELVSMSGPVWREEMINKISNASMLGDQAMQDAIMEAEHELIASVVQKFGLTEQEASDVARAAMNGKTASIEQVKNVGFWFDASANRIMVQPAFRRQLVDNYTMFPLEDFMREARRVMLAKNGNTIKNGLYTTRHNLDRVYELVQKYVRTEQLMKIAYMPKNSIGEPILATIMNEGLGNAPAMLADFGRGTARWAQNRGRQVAGIVGKPGERKANRELNNLHIQYQELLAEQDNIAMAMQALDDATISPAVRAHNLPIFDQQAKQVSRDLMSLKTQMGIADPGFSPYIDAPTFYNVRGEARSLVNVLDNPDSIAALRSEVEMAKASELARYAMNRERAAASFDANKARMDEIDSLLSLDNADLIASRDKTASVNRKLQDLRIAEQKLAGAKRALAEGPPDLNAGARKGLERTLADLREQRQLAQAVETTAQAEFDLPTGALRKSDRLADIDQQIANVERSLQTLSEVPGQLPYKYQEIADTYPQLIADIRAELGDQAPEFDSYTQLLIDELDKTRTTQAHVKQAASAQINDIKANMPQLHPVQPGSEILDYKPTADEIKNMRAWATSQVDEELASNAISTLAPERYGAPLSTVHRSVLEKEGLIPLKWAENVLLRNNGARATGWLDEFALWLKTGYADPEKAVAAGWDVSHIEIPGLGELRGMAVNRAGTSDKVTYIKLDWYPTKDARLAKIESYTEDGLAELSLQKVAEHDAAQAEIDRIIADSHVEVADHQATIDELADEIARVKAGKPANSKIASLVENPLPGPYQLSRLRSERAKLEAENVGHDKVIVQPHAFTPQLQGKIQQLDIAEKLAGADAKTQQKVRDLYSKVQDLANQRHAVGSSSIPNRTVEEVEADIAAVVAKLGAKRDASLARRAQVEANRERSMIGQTDRTLTLPSGEEITGPGLFASDNFGSARKADFSASHTNKVTVDPAQRGMAATNRVGMIHDTVTVLGTDPRYFDELAYVANRHVTGDKMARQVLQGDSKENIISWFSTADGLEYQKDMGWTDFELRDRVNQATLMINQYFPTQEAKNLVLAGETSPIQLEKALKGISPDELAPVQGGALERITTGDASRGWLTKVGNKLWDALATKPENLFRYSFAQRAMDREMTSRLGMLEGQGIRITPSEFNATYNAAAQAVLKDARKTFYNIIRYSQPVYAARYFMVYPGAYFNTLYRMARLTWKNPGTAAYLANQWQGFFTQHGLDENGNPTDDYSKVKTLVFNVPESFRNIGVSPQLKMPAGSFELFSDRQGASWTVQIPVSTLLARKPETNDTLKQVLGPAYNSIFPFGSPSGLTDYQVLGVPVGGLIPSYLKSISHVVLHAAGINDDQYTRVATTILQHDAANWDFFKSHPELGVDPGEKPTIDSVARKAMLYWVATGIAQFNIPGGGGLQPSGQIEKDKINQIVQKYNGDREAALPEVMQAFPNLDAKDLMASTSAYRAYIPSTVAAYELVTDPALHNTLATITANQGNGDPEMVSLLVADKTGTFDANIYDALGNLTLPGDTSTNRTKLPAELVAARMDATKSWDIFNNVKSTVMAEVQRRGLKSMPDDLQEAWNSWMSAFSKQPQNATWLAQYSRTDRGTATRALNTLTMGLTVPEMKKYRNTKYWSDVKTYMDLLPSVQEAFASYKGDKAAQDELKSSWDVWVNQAFGASDPVFMGAYNKYLAGYDLEAG